MARDPVKITGDLVAANRATATTQDQTITTNGFNSVAFDNEGSVELIITIDQPIATATRKLFISPGKSYCRSVRGKVIHYATASGTTTFKYDAVE